MRLGPKVEIRKSSNWGGEADTDDRDSESSTSSVKSMVEARLLLSWEK